MIILAIDTSADETSVAITRGFAVMQNVVYSQIKLHTSWGGIVPHIAKYEHSKRIDKTIEKAINGAIRSGSIKSKSDITAIAITIGPGLSPALEVGVDTAKKLAAELDVPIIPVNHMEGHLYSAFVGNSKVASTYMPPREFMGLLVSGGHTEIVKVCGNGRYEIVGQTLDDAAGEAIDKGAKALGLGYPGGQVVEKLSLLVQNRDKFKFPRTMLQSGDYNFSFSGLKTHLYYFLKGEKAVAPDLATDLNDILSSYQEAIFDSILRKLDKYLRSHKCDYLSLGGGVTVNKRFKYLIKNLCRKHSVQLAYPKYKYLYGDNAAMIGAAGYMAYLRGEYTKTSDKLSRIPRLKIDQKIQI